MVTHSPHSRCFACGPENGSGLRLAFSLEPDRSVSCRFTPSTSFDSYPQVLHSGIVATFLDSAMAHCMFAQGHTAYASEITVRYLAPVLSGREVVVKGRFIRGRFPSCVLEARLLQDGKCRASAKGTYMKEPQVALGLSRSRSSKEEGGRASATTGGDEA